MERRLQGLQHELEAHETESLLRLEKELHEEYNQILVQEELIWYQKSREKWVKLGDRNTKFFHIQTVVRRKRNKIHGLFVGDEWCTDPEGLKAGAQAFFTNLFSVDSQVVRNHVMELMPPSISAEDRNDLVEPVSLEEVRRAVMAMNSFKAPGADGFQAFFFKQYWDILGDDLHAMVADAFSNGKGETSLLETLIVLIPKIENPLRFKDLRPISLCNVAYKVITKVLVNRFRPLLNDLVNPLQGSFIPGRGTKDNIILAQEVMHTIHTYKRKGGLVAMKIDLEKAYDRVSWDFLRATLHDFGFPPTIVELIMWGVTSASISILWNGSKLESFSPQRGLRQGDPLSPYLFVLCMERLALLIQKRVVEGSWHPIRIAKEGMNISHLFFADDILLFCQASRDQLHIVSETLKDFCEASGMRVNLDKSRMCCSKTVAHATQESFSSIMGFRRASNLGKYLGIPLIKGRVTRDVFLPILDKVNARLASWKTRMLNKAGKLCLAKSVLTSIPIYTMQSLWLPQAICDIIDKKVRCCLWAKGNSNRGWSLVSWDEIIKPKEHGGLGLRSARLNNIAMLGSLVEDLLHHNGKPWVTALSQKYLKPDGVLQGAYKSGDSYIWRSITRAIEYVGPSFKPLLGDGSSSMWYVNWMGTGRLCDRVPFVNIADTQLIVADLWQGEVEPQCLVHGVTSGNRY